MAARLPSVLRPTDLLAHPGGDEFVVVCEDPAAAAAAQQVAARLLATLDAPFPLMGQDVVIGASVGVATTTGDARAEELLRYADLAMYRAKDQGGGRLEVFDDRFREQVQQRLSTESALRQALEHDELRVHYQPIVELLTGHTTSVEALVRWHRRGHGTVAPDTFIPLPRDRPHRPPRGAGPAQGVPAGGGVVAKPAELGGVGLAVNLSARQLHHPSLLDTVRQALDHSGLVPDRLTLELTESVLAQDYSSLAYLRTFPIDVLKIDKRFIDRAGATRADDAIIETIISLARALGLRVVAEGVETAEQAALLATLGCTSGQGYFFARPAPPDQLRVPDLALRTAPER